MKQITMRAFFGIVFTSACAFSSVDAAPKTPTQAEQDYVVGSLVSQCMVAKCQIFRGFILTDFPHPGTPEVVRVQEWLYGTSAKETVEVPYEDDSAGHSTKDGIYRLADTWRRVSAAQNTSVTVVQKLDNLLGRAGEPTLITSDDRQVRLIRSLIEGEHYFKGSPDAIKQAVESLAQTPNPALAGFLDLYITFHLNPSSPDLAAQLRFEMIGSDSLPRVVFFSIAGALSGNYSGLSKSGKATLVQNLNRLVNRFAASQNPKPIDASAALAGAYALQGIVKFDHEVASITDPSVRVALAKAYVGLVRNREMGRMDTLEAELAVSPTDLKTDPNQKNK
jgi:hypothetical protein